MNYVVSIFCLNLDCSFYFLRCFVRFNSSFSVFSKSNKFDFPSDFPWSIIIKFNYPSGVTEQQATNKPGSTKPQS